MCSANTSPAIADVSKAATIRPRSPRTAAARALAPLLLGVILLGCDEGPAPLARVLLVGIDGASPRLVEPLLADGRLPQLASIAAAGLYTPLRSFVPLLSPRIWNTIATGKTPEKHGIHAFTRAENGRPVLLLSSDRKAHALWNIASDAGLRVAVINWWNTYPPERINGVMVSDHAKPGQVDRLRSLTGADEVPTGPVVHPEAWSARLAESFADPSPVARLGDPFAEGAALPEHVKTSELIRFRDTDAALVRIALRVEAEEKPQLLMVLLPGIDRVSHWLWGSVEPAELYAEELRPTPSQQQAARRALEAYYAFTDALLGLLLARFGPEDLVLVLSDHGFERAAPASVLSGIHWSKQARDGVLFARGRGVASRGTERVTVRDITPTVLAWLGLPVARDMDGHAAAFLEAAPRETVDTYDTTPIERLEAAPSPAEDEILDELRALGYIE